MHLPLKIYRITGNSMHPTLADGDYVLTLRWWWSLKAGNIIAAFHPNYPPLIKRIKSIDQSGYIWLLGDGKESLSTESMGKFSKKQILGKVIYCVKAKHASQK